MGKQINEIQQIELELLKEFKRICKKYELRYFAIGGTCIGAVRHKGFIPWDDDIDIAMPFKDYKKFQLVARKELSEGLSLYLPENHRYWYSNFIKLQNDCTTFIESGVAAIYPDDYRGVYIDIMPVYGMPKGKVSQYLASTISSFLVVLNQIHRLPLRDHRSKKRKILWCLNVVVRKIKPFNYYIDIIERLFSKYPFNNSDKIIFGWRRMPSRFRKNYTYQNVFNYVDFNEEAELPFEDTSIAVPCGYDRYLTMDFGDYMKLPPKEERRSNHETVLIDLNKSYKHYIKEGIPK